MEITLIGFVVIILSIYAFFKDEYYLLYLAVFFSTFTAASILNIKSTVTGITPFYFIASLWMIKVFIKYIKNRVEFKDIFYEIKNNKLIKALLTFSLVILVGEILFAFKDGVSLIDLNSGKNVMLSFSSYNITQTIYLLFMIVFTILVLLEVKEKKKIITVLKVFFISSIFAVVWGIIQFCLFYLNIEYPSNLFNNNIAYLQLYNQMIYGIKRVNSIALEPSMFALNIIVFIPFILVLWTSGKKIIKNKVYSNIILSVILVLSLMCSILTTSTTAYVGVGLVIIFFTIYQFKFSEKDGEIYKNKIKMIFIYIIIIISLILVLILTLKVFGVAFQTIVDVFKDITINKKNLQTGHERTNAIKMSLNILYSSPLFGVGWGTFRSLDLTSNLLANTGILGLISYFYIIAVVIIRLFKNKAKDEIISISMLLSILISSIALLISIPDLNYGYYWLMIGLGFNYCNVK